MGNPTRKRIRALRRAPDGSAFQDCKKCGLSVAVAIADMHECEVKMGFKRFKGEVLRSGSIKEKSFDLKAQPRSAFCFFMEHFMRINEAMNQFDVDREGFNTWKSLSKQERLPYILQAEKVNSEYERTLLQEVEDMLWVNEEADSAEVGRFDKKYDKHPYFDDSDSSGSFCFGASGSFFSDEWY